MPKKVEKVETMQKADFHIEAESEWGVERGVNFALQKIAKGHPDGNESIPIHGIKVAWRMITSNVPSVIPEFRPGAPTLSVEEGMNLPDISKMDIEDAKGIIGTVRNLEELEQFKLIEQASIRVEGGRKGVFNYIESLNKEIHRTEAKKVADEAKAEAKAKVEAKAEKAEKTKKAKKAKAEKAAAAGGEGTEGGGPSKG